MFLDYASLGFVEEREGATDSVKRREKVVDAIKEHIQESAGAGVSLDRLAVISGYSKYHFLRMFKDRTGTTVHEYVNQCRMAKCRELLSEGARKSEISDILGFSSPATFSRWLHARAYHHKR
jgi:AraC-like DNA-binding protein